MKEALIFCIFMILFFVGILMAMYYDNKHARINNEYKEKLLKDCIKENDILRQENSFLRSEISFLKLHFSEKAGKK